MGGKLGLHRESSYFAAMVNMKWLLFSSLQHYGYTWLIANQTHLSLELVINDDNEVKDGLYIEKYDSYEN